MGVPGEVRWQVGLSCRMRERACSALSGLRAAAAAPRASQSGSARTPSSPRRVGSCCGVGGDAGVATGWDEGLAGTQLTSCCVRSGNASSAGRGETLAYLRAGLPRRAQTLGGGSCGGGGDSSGSVPINPIQPFLPPPPAIDGVPLGGKPDGQARRTPPPPRVLAPAVARTIERRAHCLQELRLARLDLAIALWQPPPARRPGRRGTRAATKGRRPSRPPRPHAFDPEHLGHRLRSRPVGRVQGSRGGRQLGGTTWPLLASTCHEPRSAARALPQTAAWRVAARCTEALPESPAPQLSRRRRRRRYIGAPHPSQALARARARRRRGLRAGRSMS
eukprot:scaffold4120_cov57-Phaeocystis_antarctica.AAC.3